MMPQKSGHWQQQWQSCLAQNHLSCTVDVNNICNSTEHNMTWREKIYSCVNPSATFSCYSMHRAWYMLTCQDKVQYFFDKFVFEKVQNNKLMSVKLCGIIFFDKLSPKKCITTSYCVWSFAYIYSMPALWAAWIS